MAFHWSTTITWMASLCDPPARTTYIIISSTIGNRPTDWRGRSGIETVGIGGVQGSIWTTGYVKSISFSSGGMRGRGGGKEGTRNRGFVL